MIAVETSTTEAALEFLARLRRGPTSNLRRVWHRDGDMITVWDQRLSGAWDISYIVEIKRRTRCPTN